MGTSRLNLRLRCVIFFFIAENVTQHQAELNDYLQSKSINQLFIQIVESLLIEKPENPIGFIVEFLQKKYPDQAGVASVSGLSQAARDIGNLNSGEANEKISGDDDDDDEEGEEEEEEAYMDEMPENTIFKRDKKRVSICAEVIQENHDDVKEFDKTLDERIRILEILEQQVLFRHLEKEQKEFIARAMFVVEYKAGDTIISQGDDGDNFYVIDRGNVECFKCESGVDDEKLVHTYSPGGAFGELAIMYNAPRAATCRAISECRLFALDRKAFKVILMKTTIEKRSQTKSFLQNVEILKQLKEYELFTMADAMQELIYEESDVICRQGDAGSNFYIIKQGSVVCTQADAQGKQQEVARLTVGDYFGEIALLTSKPRQATVVAAESGGTLTLLSLDRSTFNRILGSIEDILRRNMVAYNKFRSAQI